MIKDDAEVIAYLPKFSKTHRPNKQWLCNIINTVHHNSVGNLIRQVKEAKLENKEV